MTCSQLTVGCMSCLCNCSDVCLSVHRFSVKLQVSCLKQPTCKSKASLSFVAVYTQAINRNTSIAGFYIHVV